MQMPIYESRIRRDLEHGRGGHAALVGTDHAGRFRATVEGSLVRDNSDSGAVMLQANDQRLTVQYQLRSGKVIDTYTIAA